MTLRTLRTLRFAKRPSQKQIRNFMQGLDALHKGATPEFEPTATRKTGKQKETSVVKAVQELWSALKRGVLYRNRRGMVELASGARLPMGLGPNGAGDVIGYTLVQITPGMLNKTLPIYTELEGKTEVGRLAPHQLARIEELRDVNAITGCVRGIDDADAVLSRWVERVTGDER